MLCQLQGQANTLRRLCVCRQVQVGELLGDAPQGWVPPQGVAKLQRLGMHRSQRLARAKLREQERLELEAEFEGDDLPSVAGLQLQPSSRHVKAFASRIAKPWSAGGRNRGRRCSFCGRPAAPAILQGRGSAVGVYQGRLSQLAPSEQLGSKGEGDGLPSVAFQ